MVTLGSEFTYSDCFPGLEVMIMDSVIGDVSPTETPTA